ncbi:nucleolin [Biomphalaria pfeifferi]|uniref:Nucleolin n=1 Tax=Biomphalaria pfeifferi TaxID=112525 RepID=A0AAD8B6N8_BIOPF|nr:nucleolin [Biomphalaria pfeifferi]
MELVNETEDSVSVDDKSDEIKTDPAEFDNTAEDMMTDMKLEDEIDEVRSDKPDFNWLYHIEIYPWNADDMTENFIRLIKLAQFSQICLRKKGVGKETDDSEKADDKLSGRLRIGCLHLYTDTSQNAKNIMRSATWKTMAAKQLVFELTKQGPSPGQLETATLEVDTYLVSKSRFRDKPKGELKDRSAKVSNLPGTISREFLDVVFSRAYAVVEGTTIREYLKEKEGKSQQRLLDLKDFNGWMDFDCLGRGSCRSFVLAHKSVTINGQKVSIEANDKDTMVVPPFTQAETSTKPDVKATAPDFNAAQNKARVTSAKIQGPSQPVRLMKAAMIPCILKDTFPNNFRGRGRASVVPQRPATASFIRAGPGMPVPMTGRQKMHEKLRRNNFGTAALGTGLLINPGTVGNRGSVLNPVGDSFKLELESLQNQLEQSTQALEAKIAMLQQQSTQAAAYYHGNILTEGDWEDEELNYNIGYSDDSYVLGDTCYASDETLDYHYAPQTAVRLQRPMSGSYVNTAANIGTLSAYSARQGIQPRGFSVGQMSAVPKLGQSSSAAWRGDQRRVGSRGRGQFREAVTNFW